MRGIRGKRVWTVKEGMLIATVDIGMASNTGYCTTVDGRDMKPFKFENSREGFEKFWHMIVASKNRFGCSDVMIGYESTGPYAEPLASLPQGEAGHHGAGEPAAHQEDQRGKRQFPIEDGQ